MGFFSSLVSSIKSAGSDLVADAKKVAPIVVAVYAPELAPEVGAAMGLTGTAAAAAGGAAIAGGVTALEGGTPKQILGSALAGGAGGAAAGLAGGGVGGAAAGGAVSGGLNAAETGQNIGQGALKGGLVGGASALGAQEASNLLSPGQAGTGLKVPANSLDIAPSSTAATVNPTEPYTGTGVKAPVNAFQDINTTIESNPNIGVPTNTGLQYNLAPTEFNPGGVDYGFSQAQDPSIVSAEPIQASGLSPEAQRALQSVIGFGLNTALAPKSSLPKSALPTISEGTTGTTSGTTGGSPGGTELDPSTGKTPQLVWGDKYSSLKEGLNV